MLVDLIATKQKGKFSIFVKVATGNFSLIVSRE